MSYEEIIPAAYLAQDEGWKKTFQAITFPPSWTKPLLALQRYDRPDPSKYKSVPTRRLSQLMRALFPQVVSTGRDITADDASPWLYLHDADDSPSALVPTDLITAALLSWAHTINPKPGSEDLRQEAIDRILATPLTWATTTVDLFQKDLTAGGTGQPAPAAYHLLPDSIAADILRLAPLSLGTQQIRFLRTSTPNGAELISWPPRQAQEDDGKTGYFSIYLAITLQTLPFSDQFRVHLHTGTRRWVNRANSIAWGRRATVYMLTDAPWMHGLPLTPGFSSSSLGWDSALGEHGWRIGGPEGMLQRLTLSRSFPTPTELLAAPETWIAGRDGVTAAITHHTTMGAHPAGAGLMPADRAPLMDWAYTAMSAHLRPVPTLTKSPRSGTVLTPAQPPTGSDDAQKNAWKQRLLSEAGREQQRRLADHLTEHTITATGQRARLDVDLMIASEKIRTGLKMAMMADLALDEPTVAADGAWHWELEHFDLRVHHVALGRLGDKLVVVGRKDRKDKARQQITQRREEIRSYLTHNGTPSTVAIVELTDSFNDAYIDPKYAIRLGCAAAGRITQFVTPPKQFERPVAFGERMLAVWRDGVRQLGVRAIPQHTLGDAVPPDMQYVGLWMIKRRADGPTHRAQHLPVAVLVSPNQATVRGTAPGLQDWVDYRTLLLYLADEGAKPVPDKPMDRQAAMATFVKRLTAQLRNTTTLLVTHAQNSRAAWPWLQNGSLIADSVGLGNNPPVPLRHLAGQGLRIIRVRDSSGRETPQWYSPGRGAPGLASGLWRDPSLGGADARTFFSTTPKPGTMQKVAVSASKIVPRINKIGAEQIDATTQAHNPQLLELTVVAQQQEDIPELWAALIHQQRQTPDYRAALANPLCLHLAKLASEYLLPYDVEELRDIAELPDNETTDSEPSEPIEDDLNDHD